MANPFRSMYGDCGKAKPEYAALHTTGEFFILHFIAMPTFGFCIPSKNPNVFPKIQPNPT